MKSIIERFHVVEECEGCNKVTGDYCEAYYNPGVWFRNGGHCPLASHIKTTSSAPKGKVRVGQQKHM